MAWPRAFRDPELERLALVHRSAGRRNNERLEFFGDALIGAVVSEMLIERFPRADEGALTRMRSSLVRESALAAIARRYGFGDRLELGPGELKTGGHRRDSILADAVEAMAAAVYLDGGFEALREVLRVWFSPPLAELDLHAGKDAKTRLQEWLQARQLPLPEYAVLEELGEEHCREFRVRCTLNEPALAREGLGSSRRGAEQAAAESILEALDGQG
ncbi:ribonuclease III [Pseudomarimonas salicorniae]|uniref:Ribonuclease 3 n=1 Tax=Pseudomarimonas salicorniae TaxID=2933270 RepID=A0ABT0GJS8_9GAMM|nr:ribonuclease III [Lysobacter sp. CAU 1642]